MQMLAGERFASMDRAFLNAVRSVLLMIDEFSHRHPLTSQIDDLRGAIADLALPADKHGCAMQRIRNIHRYLAAGENGAAIYELRALLQGLSEWAKANNDALAFAPMPAV